MARCGHGWPGRAEGSAGFGPGEAAQQAGDRAAAYGVVDTLLVEAEVPGVMGEDGPVSFDTAGGSLTEEIARRALEAGGRIVVTQAARIPCGGELAAILRHPV